MAELGTTVRDRGGLSTPLPAQLSAFFGRERDIAQVLALVRRQDVRLLTITGPGGVGKTRLALRVAADLTDDFADGVAFVSLAPVADPDLVGSTVASVLGLRDGGDRPLNERLAELLRDRSALLVVDNFEHVLAAAPFVAELLAACPGLKVLATSRESLHLTGEHVFALAPMRLPDERSTNSADTVASFDAVRLFVARAGAARSDFTLTDANAEAVAGVCNRLDGLPLAIELAAARAAHLPPAALLQRLSNRLPLLTGGARDLPARQRTIRDTIAWSHDLLSLEEQVLFRRLAVFAGGFTLEAAEDVAGSRDVTGLDVLSGIASLVDKSLVREDEGESGEPRYFMLETVREFAWEQLAASGEESAIRNAQARWTLGLCASTSEFISRNPQLSKVDELTLEMANIRAALTWLEQSGQDAELVRLIESCHHFWYYGSHLMEGSVWFKRALELMPDEPTEARARALYCIGEFSHFLGDDEAAVRSIEEATLIADQIDSVFENGETFFILGVIAEDNGQYERAEELFQKSRERYIRAGSTFDIIIDTYHLGVVAFGRNDIERAIALFEEAIEVGSAQGDTVVVNWACCYLGLIYAELGDPQRSAEELSKVVAHVLDGALRHIRHLALSMFAVLGWACNAAEVAVRLLGASEAARFASGVRPQLPERASWERVAAKLQLTLGDAAYARAFVEGKSKAHEAVMADVNLVLTAARAPAVPSADGHGLTVRELEVLRLLVDGRSNPDIAEILFISPRTATTHVTNILAKLGVASRTEAATRAVRDGII